VHACATRRGRGRSHAHLCAWAFMPASRLQKRAVFHRSRNTNKRRCRDLLFETQDSEREKAEADFTINLEDLERLRVPLEARKGKTGAGKPADAGGRERKASHVGEGGAGGAIARAGARTCERASLCTLISMSDAVDGASARLASPRATTIAAKGLLRPNLGPGRGAAAGPPGGAAGARRDWRGGGSLADDAAASRGRPEGSASSGSGPARSKSCGSGLGATSSTLGVQKGTGRGAS
jgi:hypothetical protein